MAENKKVSIKEQKIKFKSKDDIYLRFTIDCRHLLKITCYNLVQYFLPSKRISPLGFIRDIIIKFLHFQFLITHANSVFTYVTTIFACVMCVKTLHTIIALKRVFTHITHANIIVTYVNTLFTCVIKNWKCKKLIILMVKNRYDYFSKDALGIKEEWD